MQNQESGISSVAIIAIVVLVLIGVFVFLPMMKQKNGATVNVPSSIDVNLNK